MVTDVQNETTRDPKKRGQEGAAEVFLNVVLGGRGIHMISFHSYANPVKWALLVTQLVCGRESRAA